MHYTNTYLEYARRHHEELLANARQARLGKVVVERQPRPVSKVRLAIANALIAWGTKLKTPLPSRPAYLVHSSSLNDLR